MNKSDKQWCRDIKRRVKAIGEKVRAVREHSQEVVYRIRWGLNRHPYEPLEPGWYCEYCDKPMHEDDEGVTWDDTAYCSEDCVEADKARH